MSLQADGRRSLKAESVHLESVHPQVVIPVTADLTILVDDTIPVKTDIASSITLPVTAVPYQISVPKGDVSGVASVKVRGRNSDVDLGSSPEDIWEGSGIWVEPTTARIHDIVSSNVGDAAAGLGAQSLLVNGLDGTGLEISETISMNGVTVVPTVNSYTMINDLRVTAVGATGVNIGTITATAQTDLTITAVILPTDSKSLMAIYKVPSDKTAYMSNLNTSFIRKGTSGYAIASLLVKLPGQGWVAEHPAGLQVAGNSSNNQDFDPYIQYASGTLLKVQSAVDDKNCILFAGFQLYLVDN